MTIYGTKNGDTTSDGFTTEEIELPIEPLDINSGVAISKMSKLLIQYKDIVLTVYQRSIQ